MQILHILRHTHLTGVGTPLHDPCTQHAVVQHTSVDLRSFASRVGDQEHTSVQQVAAVPL